MAEAVLLVSEKPSNRRCAFCNREVGAGPVVALLTSARVATKASPENNVSKGALVVSLDWTEDFLAHPQCLTEARATARLFQLLEPLDKSQVPDGYIQYMHDAEGPEFWLNIETSQDLLDDIQLWKETQNG